MDLADLRRNYTKGGLSEENLDPNPFQQFELWFQQAIEAKLIEPNAMTLATATTDAKPFLRTVLLKYFDTQGFVFFTNYSSRKAQQINDNPNVCILFPWIALERQVIIQGKVTKISTAESLKYFISRPRGSQLGAWCSPQSSVISSRKLLEEKLEEVKRKFQDQEIPLPSFWGGYRVIPNTFEFWQGRENRLHDRFFYTLLEDKSWQIERLAP